MTKIAILRLILAVTFGVGTASEVDQAHASAPTSAVNSGLLDQAAAINNGAGTGGVHGSGHGGGHGHGH